MDHMETKQIISWLLDKAARAQDHSYARMLNQAAMRLKELDQAQSVTQDVTQCVTQDVTQSAVKWIPVTERLPDRDGFFIVCTKHNFYKTTNVAKASFKKHSGGFYGQGGLWSNVTHWMPIPELPKEE